MTSVLVALVVSTAGALIGQEVDRRCGVISRAIVRAASHLLPPKDAKRYRDEWVDMVTAAGEKGLKPLLQAFSIALWGAPKMAGPAWAQRYALARQTKFDPREFRQRVESELKARMEDARRSLEASPEWKAQNEAVMAEAERRRKADWSIPEKRGMHIWSLDAAVRRRG